MKKIFLALPTIRYIEPEAEESLRDFVYPGSSKFILSHHVVRRGSSNVYYQRHNLAQDFLKTDADYYLYWDSDNAIVAPKNAIDMLIDDNRDIICPLIVRRIFPHLPCVISYEKKAALVKGAKFFLEDFRKQIYPKDRPFPVWRASGGIVLIKRSVIENMDKPFYPEFDNNGFLIGTDMSFYKKAEEMGLTQWVEPRIHATHIGHFPFMIDDYYALLDSKSINEKNIIMKEDGV